MAEVKERSVETGNVPREVVRGKTDGKIQPPTPWPDQWLKVTACKSGGLESMCVANAQSTFS